MNTPNPMSGFVEDSVPASTRGDVDCLLINIDGYEGPLDILLELARRQKVDLARLSIVQLVRQYLDFIAQAKELRLDLAADYLVMAAWLTYLKSRLLLPKSEQVEEDSLTADQMAAALQFQLRRLEALQDAAQRLWARPKLGQQVFARPIGLTGELTTDLRIIPAASLYDLLTAYGDIQQRQQDQTYELPVFHLMSMDDALRRLTAMLGELPRAGQAQIWTTLSSLLPEAEEAPLYQASSLASLFTAGLELAKQGGIDLKQEGAFAPIYLRPTPAFHEREAA